MLERERNLSLALPCIWIVIGQTNFQRSLRLQVENGLWHQLNLTSQQSADLKKLVEKFHFPLSQIYWARLAKVIKVILDFFFSTRKVREFGLIFLQLGLKLATIQAFLSLILRCDCYFWLMMVLVLKKELFFCSPNLHHFCWGSTNRKPHSRLRSSLPTSRAHWTLRP